LGCLFVWIWFLRWFLFSADCSSVFVIFADGSKRHLLLLLPIITAASLLLLLLLQSRRQLRTVLRVCSIVFVFVNLTFFTSSNPPGKATKANAAAPSTAPPKLGIFGSTAAPTTEEKLLALVKQDSRLSSKASQIANWIKEQDWNEVVVVLKSSAISNSLLVSSLLKDVLGPIAEAQSIAKAVIGIAAAIVDM
jgi:hypothetical protein